MKKKGEIAHKNPRRHRSSAHIKEDSALDLPWNGGVRQNLQHVIGNRAIQRVRQSGVLKGEKPLSSYSPAQLRQAVLAQVASKTDHVPLIQKDDLDAETLDAGPTVADTGTVTIEEPVLDEYEVTGTTLAGVHGQLDPEEWGRCRWTVDYDYETTNGRVTRVNITLRLTIRMPRWGEGFDQASPAARTEWQRMITALRAHEDHHADIARNWAPRFKDNILGQRAGRAANKYQQTMNQMEREQRNYDTSSSHGQNEGVSLDTTIP